MIKPIKVISLNCRGIKLKINKIIDHVNKSKASIILLQETYKLDDITKTTLEQNR